MEGWKQWFETSLEQCKIVSRFNAKISGVWKRGPESSANRSGRTREFVLRSGVGREGRTGPAIADAFSADQSAGELASRASLRGASQISRLSRASRNQQKKIGPKKIVARPLPIAVSKSSIQNSRVCKCFFQCQLKRKSFVFLIFAFFCFFFRT